MPERDYTEEDLRLADRIRKCEREHGAKVALAALISKVRRKERERAVRAGAIEAYVDHACAPGACREDLAIEDGEVLEETIQHVLRELEGEG